MRSSLRLGLALSCQVLLIAGSELAASAQTCSHLVFRFGAPAADCGFPGVSDSGSGPFSGALLDGSQASISAGTLGLGCLHMGGGLAQIVPPGPVPEGGETRFAVEDCSLETLTLHPADTDNPRTCTLGPTAARRCLNGHPGTDENGLCTTDADCAPLCIARVCTGGSNPGTACVANFGCTGGGTCLGNCVNGPGNLAGGKCSEDAECGLGVVSGSCRPEARCTFGAPIPFRNGPTSSCQLNVVQNGAGGTANRVAGSASLNVPLESRLYLTGTAYGVDAPCPTCVASACNAGKRAGQPCTTDNAALTSNDCPPDDRLFLAEIPLNLSPLTTGMASETDPAGLFCADQDNNPPGSAGAFGVQAARTIIENGSSAAGGFLVAPAAVTLASVFCTPATGHALVDGAFNLPGPGAVTLRGTIELASNVTTTSSPSSSTTTVVTPTTTSTTTTTLACTTCSIDIADPGRRKTTATCTAPLVDGAVPDGAQCAGHGTNFVTGEVVIDAVARPLKAKRKQGNRTARVKLRLNALGKALLKAQGSLPVRVTVAITTGSQTSLRVEKAMGFVH